jgi:hypothetical protein
VYPLERVVKWDYRDKLPNTILGVSRVVKHYYVYRLGIDCDGRKAYIEMGNEVELIGVVREKAKLHRDTIVLLLVEGCLISMVSLGDNRKTLLIKDIESELLKVYGRVFPLNNTEFLGKVCYHPVH